MITNTSTSQSWKKKNPARPNWVLFVVCFWVVIFLFLLITLPTNDITNVRPLRSAAAAAPGARHGPVLRTWARASPQRSIHPFGTQFPRSRASNATLPIRNPTARPLFPIVPHNWHLAGNLKPRFLNSTRAPPARPFPHLPPTARQTTPQPLTEPFMHSTAVLCTTVLRKALSLSLTRVFTCLRRLLVCFFAKE